MKIESFVLEGRLARLEPLGLQHVDELLVAACVDSGLYQWTVVPQERSGMEIYVKTALLW